MCVFERVVIGVGADGGGLVWRCRLGVPWGDGESVGLGWQVAKALLKEGSSLCPRTRAWVVVRQAIGRAESWKQVVEMVVPSYGKAKSCSRQQLEQLLREAKVRCGVRCGAESHE